MKTIKLKNILPVLGLGIAAGTILSLPLESRAFPTEIYASSSALASGNWAKIRVKQSGMQFISNAQLSQLGFTDPSTVRVYGYGGNVISENLTVSHPDDLPVVPSIRTSSGIVFFGLDNILWQEASGNSVYTHTMHPYSEAGYYFLSDNSGENAELHEWDLTDISELETADTYLERLLHEQELFAPSNTGRVLLGEDLRSGKQSFSFDLPGNAGNDATLAVSLAGNTAGSPGTFRFTSNGRLSQNSVTLDAIKSSDQFMRTVTQRLNVTDCGKSVDLEISFSSSGVVNMARLDNIEVIYERYLSMPSDQLYFYFNEQTDVAAKLSGITSETEIWDVTTGHKPEKVVFNRNGSTATFRVVNGYREFIAFNPSEVKSSVETVGKIANQDIHSLEVPDLLIITPEEYRSSAEKVAVLHRDLDDMTVHVVTPEQLYNEFSSGTPDVSAFRKALKMWYDRGLEESGDGTSKMRYCLIFSRPTYDNKMVTPTVKNAGYPRVPIWQSATGLTENTSYSTDDFIGMLEDTGNLFNMNTARINVAVGRFPVRTPEEAEVAVNKLITYLTEPEKTSWRNNVMIIADDQDSGQHLDQAEKMYANMIRSERGFNYQYERLYLDNFEEKLTSVGQEYPEAKKRLLSKFEEGQALVGYIGHANTVSWTHEHLINWGDINSFSNTRLPVLWAATCEFARWDSDEYSGAEVMWAFPKTGIIATICPSRSVFISQNGPLSAQFGNFAFTLNERGKAATLGDVMMKTKNGITTSDDNKLRYALIGDPAMRMPVPTLSVSTDYIAASDLSGEDVELPVIEARATPVISGSIQDSEGNIIDDFNGYVYLKLYDAEKVIETLGNGSDGKVMFYNDRKTKLFDGVTKVENGKWQIKVYMPSEIENNYTPGRITYYAVSDDGREANGATEKFYVYGYNKDAPEDLSGPEITKFTINHDNFKDGGITHNRPVVYAGFLDESGINLSDAGIGHALMLTLDGTTIYSDVMDFYSPDPFDSRAGSIVYQLPEITPGKHDLTLSVWDCANNSTYASISFNVALVKDPDIFDISTVYTADRSGVDFIVSSDMPLTDIGCRMEVFDLSGLRIWDSQVEERTASDSTVKMRWDYTGTSGQRVARGIYICRATVTTAEGRQSQKSKKIVVSAP